MKNCLFYLKGRRASLSITMLFLLFSSMAAFAQPIAVSGVVRDSVESLSGVSVTVKGTNVGTSTDMDGKFSIQLPNGSGILVFSRMGFLTQELEVGDNHYFDVILVANQGSLDEVVVVGMNMRQTKRSVTGAMATIQTKELRQSPVANLNNALAGRLPGLITVQRSGQPGDDAASLFIRGISTYGPNRAPLIVIDGLPRGSGSFSHIDPNEVESISILKDASSSALYGIQGANGVIVVTTKRGGASTRPSINFTSQFAFQEPVRLPESMNSYELALYTNEQDRNSGSIPRFDDAALEIVRTGSDPYLYPNVNWFDEVLKPYTPQQQHNINISGNTERMRYFVSGSFLNQGTLLKYDDVFYDNYGQKTKYNRYNFRSNIDLTPTKHLTVQVDLAGRLEQRVGPGPGFEKAFTDISRMLPYAMPIFNPDGSLAAASNVEIPYWTNPYGLVTQNGYYNNYTNVMYGTLSASHDLGFITKGLSVKSFFSFENNNYRSTSRLQNFDTYWYRGLDLNGEPAYTSIMDYTRIATSGSGSIERSNYFDIRLLYETTLAEKHILNAQLLGNRTLRVLNDELPYAYQGVSSRITYEFSRKYFAEFNMGFNGSENFPPNRRYGFFPSFSAGWIVSDESFFQNSLINFLKIRGSHGIVGNDRIGDARWLYISDFAPYTGYRFGVSNTISGGFNENRVGNEYVTWEKSRKSNVGFEASLFNSQIQVTFDAFYERRTNILTTPGAVPDYVGISNLAPRNSGKVENKGLDMDLSYRKTWEDFSFFTTANLTYTKNSVLNNDQPKPAYDYQYLVGYPVGYELGYVALGYFRDNDDIQNSPRQTFDNETIPGDIKYFDANGDGIIDANDRTPIQVHNIPNYMAGLSLGFSYKNFDLSMLLNGALGAKTFNVPRGNDPIRLQSWNPELGDDALLPVPKGSINNNVLSTFWVRSADFLKLRNAEIGYNLPSRWLETVRLRSARAFVNGQNLFVWDNLWVKDRDPEALGGNYTYPIQRIMNFGISIDL